MKNKYLKILKPIPVYADHELSAKKIKTLEAQELISYNREKRRNGKNWMEIYLEEDKVGYIEKKSDTFYKCDEVVLDDEVAKGFKITKKTEDALPLHMLFYPEGNLSLEEDKIGKIKLENIQDSDEGKKISIVLEYSKDLIEVEEIKFIKDQKFYVINESYDKNDIFIEVDTLKGKKGFLLKKTNYTKLEDRWIYYFSIGIVIITVLGIFLGFLANGWIVVSGLMVLAGIVVAFILVFVIQILLMMLKEIFNQIRKRY